MADVITNITPPRVPLVDPQTGIISREWYRFFLNLFMLTGNGANSTSILDLQVGPPVQDLLGPINDAVNSFGSQPAAPQLGTISSLNLDGVPYLGYSVSPSPNPANFTSIPVGTTWWDGGTTLNMRMTANVTQKVGESQYFYVKASGNITKGQLVMFTGAVGASGVITVAPATGVTNGDYLVGIAAENIANNGFGMIQSFGVLGGLNTNSFNEGDILYYNPSTPGGLQNTIPPAPNVKATIAAVIKKSGGNGEILIRVSTGSKLGETDSNVQITSLADNNILQYYAAGGYWRNVAPTGLSAANLSGGAAGSVPYQSAPSTTTFLGIGSAAQVLQVNSGATAPEWVSSTGTGNVARAASPTFTGTINCANIASTGTSLFGAVTSYGTVTVRGSTTGSLSYAIFADNAAGEVIFGMRDDGFIRIDKTYGFTNAAPANVYISSSGYLYRATGNPPQANNLSGGVAGSLPYQSAVDTTTFLSIGTATQILQVNAGATAPQWTSPSSITVGYSTNIAGGTAAAIPYQTGANATTFLSAGTASQLLRMNSGATAPEWVTPSSVSVGTATNLAGGAAGSVPYQTGAGATSMLSLGTAAQVLQVNSGATAPQWVSTSGTGNIARVATPSFTTTIGVGGATASASGSGISFPATQSASTDVNTLDDYEEGTWTPTLSSDGTAPTVTSYATRSGTYTKIGNRVYLTCVIRATLSAVGTGNPQVTGLPFSAASGVIAGVAMGLTNIFNTRGNNQYIITNSVTFLGYTYGTTADAYLTFSAQFET